jgi:ABC-type molybdate transport system ATPase subunit
MSQNEGQFAPHANGQARPAFEVELRGYDKRQVDGYVSRVTAELGTLAADPYAPATVLVTHHVEEIPRSFTHVMLLRSGTVIAEGPIDEALTAASVAAVVRANNSVTAAQVLLDPSAFALSSAVALP